MWMFVMLAMGCFGQVKALQEELAQLEEELEDLEDQVDELSDDAGDSGAGDSGGAVDTDLPPQELPEPQGYYSMTSYNSTSGSSTITVYDFAWQIEGELDEVRVTAGTYTYSSTYDVETHTEACAQLHWDTSTTSKQFQWLFFEAWRGTEYWCWNYNTSYPHCQAMVRLEEVTCDS